MNQQGMAARIQHTPDRVDRLWRWWKHHRPFRRHQVDWFWATGEEHWPDSQHSSVSCTYRWPRYEIKLQIGFHRTGKKYHLVTVYTLWEAKMQMLALRKLAQEIPFNMPADGPPGFMQFKG